MVYSLRDWYDFPFYSLYFMWGEKKYVVHWDAMYAANSLTQSEDAHGFDINEEEGEYSLTLELNMNDTFYYACADSEHLGPKECFELEVLKWIFNHDTLVSIRFVAGIRGCEPISPVANRDRYKEIDKDFPLAYEYVRWLMFQHDSKKPGKDQAPYTLDDYLANRHLFVKEETIV